jgi:hypothetical protein
MKNELRARIFEMTLAAFGASACASGAATEPSKLPTAAEVAKPAAASPGEASCSAAGCGAKSDTATAAPQAPAAPASPEMAAKSETVPEVTQKAQPGNDVAAPAATTPAAATTPPTPAKAKPKHVAKKAADDEGCGAGSCASKK